MDDFDVMNAGAAGRSAIIKLWTHGVPVEDQAREQLFNVAALPFIFKHVAVMPDVHWGKGATVGSVIATKGAIVPAAVGVDIGCGMMAARTNLVAADLPDTLASMRSAIEAAVPHGRTDNGGVNDRGAWGTDTISTRSYQHHSELMGIVEKHPKLERAATGHLITLERSAPAITSSRSASMRIKRSG